MFPKNPRFRSVKVDLMEAKEAWKSGHHFHLVKDICVQLRRVGL
jgi:hypothetical protein